jgi:hypothetical protein
MGEGRRGRLLLLGRKILNFVFLENPGWEKRGRNWYDRDEIV